KKQKLVTFYHDIEQNIDSKADVSLCREAIIRFIELEKKYRVAATYNVVGKIFKEQSDLIQMIREAGQEVAFHSYNHQSDWNSNYYVSEVKACREAADWPVGYRSPRSRFDNSTLSQLFERGFLWSAESDIAKEPYFIYKGLVRMPIALDDWPIYMGKLNIDKWLSFFSKILDERRYIAVGFHDSVASFDLEKMLGVYEAAIKEVKKKGAFFLSFSEGADLFRRAAVEKYYNKAAKEWNKDTQRLYRTKRFREIIKEEAQKIERPIIVDLGSAGGILTSPLKKIASKIYLVDNASGMVSGIDSDGILEPKVGDATTSGLPDKSVDVVVAARIVEYLFNPDDLAFEIRRIAKPGAVFIVTFPVLREGKKETNEGNPPNRVRHYFSLEEVKRWAEKIGPGRLFGVQYKKMEPVNIEEEEQYRKMEENPDSGTIPINWVFVGKVGEGGEGLCLSRRKLPLSLANFVLPSEWIAGLKSKISVFKKYIPKPVKNLLRPVVNFILGR
ncbi:MAG: hypothetical protein A2390_02635, partial [Candidatus Liptonbacteria bacterium RIFOXYB1_FULL_36_10]